ncbi:methyltransferase [Candidatus Woesearchaeota archaeon]|nr:methyltransferase [Candidatus Woesearchaeota archaeon]
MYDPDEDSYLIGEQLKKFHDLNVLDLGTGSGFLAEISIKNNCKVLAADINKKAVEYCNKKGIKAIYSNLFSNISEKFDLIVFNPPYLPLDENEQKDSRVITTAGKKGHEIIEKFLKQAKGHLNKKGKILILFSSLSGDIPYLFEKYRYKHKKLSEKKLFFESIYVYLIE